MFLAIRNPEAGEIIRQIRKDLAKDITDFINQHAPELGLEGTSTDEENSREVHEGKYKIKSVFIMSHR